MVCFNKSLPTIPERIDFFRIPFNRLTFDYPDDGLETLVKVKGQNFSSENFGFPEYSQGIKRENINVLDYNEKTENINNTSQLYEYSLKNILLEVSVRGSIIAGFIGIVYETCRLLEYYGIIEKTVR